MNICIFHDFLHLNDEVIKGWKEFTNFFIKKNYKIIFLTERISDKKNLEEINLDTSIKIYSINENIDESISYDEETINKYNSKYVNTKLFQERLSILRSPYSCFYQNNKIKNNFDNLLITHLKFLENLMISNKINYIFAGIINSYQSYNNTILENIALKNDIKFLIYQHPILRSRVYDNQLRVSKEVNSNYEKNLIHGLSDSEKLKTSNFIKHYIEYLNSDDHYDYVYKRTFVKKAANFKSKIKTQIKKLNPKYKSIHFFDIKDINKNYSVLILNKNNNYRLLKFSPFFSNPASIIRSISLSLPMNHELVIKLHPHDININVTDTNLIDEVLLHHNVKILDPKIKLTDVVPNADITFAPSSTSTIIETLIFFKHIITFGDELHHIGKYKSPIKKIINLEDLKNTINYCLNNDVDKDKILFFINAFLNGSFSRIDDSDEWIIKLGFGDGSQKVDKIYIKAAERLEQYMSINNNKININ